jgi:hypothetical protein
MHAHPHKLGSTKWLKRGCGPKYRATTVALRSVPHTSKATPTWWGFQSDMLLEPGARRQDKRQWKSL